MAGLLEQAGARPNRDPKFAPLFMDRTFTGLYTQRSPLHDPSDSAVTRYYGGRPDALWDGANVELTNRLTLQRRPGLLAFSSAIYPTPPQRAFEFELTDGTIRVIVDTGNSDQADGHVASVDSGTGVYHGTFPHGGLSAYVGLYFTITGFVTNSGQNNGTFICTASTTTTLTLLNSNAVAETHAAFAVTAGGVYWDQQNSSTQPTLLFGKNAGAGQAHFATVAGVLYIGDGVEVKKYTPSNVNGEIWKWGIAAPTAPPIINVVSAGGATVNWQANTFFSTMGLIVDSNNFIQALASVNDKGDNPNSAFGTSGIGSPTWNPTTGGVTTETSGLQWRNIGPLVPWQATYLYGNWIDVVNGVVVAPACIWEQSVQPGGAAYVFESLADHGNSGVTRPNFTSGIVNVTQFNDPPNNPPNGQHWQFEGNADFINANNLWQPSTFYTHGQTIVEARMPPAADETLHMQVCISAAGFSGGSASYTPSWSQATGIPTHDNQLTWVCLGSASWQATTVYSGWSDPHDPNFSAIVDSNGNFQVCTTGGTSGGTTPNWQSGYGSPTHDGFVVWACAGPAAASVWSPGTAYCLPTVGFFPPQSATASGGASVIGNGDVQTVVQSGLSGAAVVWTPPLTSDNQVVWQDNGAPAQAPLVITKGYGWVYAYKARTFSDSYNTSSPPGVDINGNPLPSLNTPSGSGTGAISSASPPIYWKQANAGAAVTLTLTGSLDPQVDTIELYRTTDGGATFIFDTDLPNPAPVAGSPGKVNFQDFMPDTAASNNVNLPGLNPLLEAPVDDVNDPPDNSFLPMAYNFQRIWGSANHTTHVGPGSSIDFSGGPDTLVGNPNEAFDPSDTFPYLATVVRAVKTSNGLIVFLTNGVERIAGGPSTASFFSVTLAPGIGLGNFNALDIYAGELFFLSADGQFMVMSPDLQLANFGFPIGDKLVQFDTSKSYVAVLQAGLDSAMFVTDGATGWYRLNPRQIPGGFGQPEPIWSPFAAITNGCKMVQTVEITPGNKKLLVGSTLPGQQILKRDLNTFTDNGATYDAWFTMGSIMLAHPGQLALLKFLEADFSGVGFRPTISFLLNEIGGTFTSFTQTPTFDPPSLYGKTVTPSSYSPNRYYFNGEHTLARCRHLQIKFDFGQTSIGNELYNLTIFGRLVVEP